MLDVVIIGGGPAGATAGRLLAQWGHKVAILTAPPAARSMAECLPPSCRKLFQFLGILEAVDGAGFFRTTGNTVWWNSEMRVENYPEGCGYQVLRREFDRLLLDLARLSGARVRVGKASAEIKSESPVVSFQGGEAPARFVMDCSGRARVISRLFHVKQSNLTAPTVGLCGIWQNKPNFGLPDETHTLVEAYDGGWAWSVPVSPQIRHVGFVTRSGARYRDEMAKTREFQRIFAKAKLQGKPWGRDASVYSSRQYSGPGFLIAGDAGATIDPLSSFGVKKAIASGWVGAVAANTWLREPEKRDDALRFFEAREREVFAAFAEESAKWHAGGI